MIADKVAFFNPFFVSVVDVQVQRVESLLLLNAQWALGSVIFKVAKAQLAPNHDGWISWSHHLANGGRNGRYTRRVRGHVVESCGWHHLELDGHRPFGDHSWSSRNTARQRTWSGFTQCGCCGFSANHNCGFSFDQGQWQSRMGCWSRNWCRRMNWRVAMGSILFDHVSQAYGRWHCLLQGVDVFSECVRRQKWRALRTSSTRSLFHERKLHPHK